MKFIVYLSKSNPLGIILDFVNVAVGYNFPFHIPGDSCIFNPFNEKDVWVLFPLYKFAGLNQLHDFDRNGFVSGQC